MSGGWILIASGFATFFITFLLLEIPLLLSPYVIIRWAPPSTHSSSDLTPPVSSPHPVTLLINEGTERYNNLLSSQSTTLEAATKEYRRRYSRDPPKGFDDWFAFAAENNVTIIDEYDSLMKDFSPFWKLSGEEFRERVHFAGRLPSIELVELKDGNSTMIRIEKNYVDKEGKSRASGFQRMMDKFAHKLPDMYFPINSKAEGRVLVPWEQKQDPLFGTANSSDTLEKLVQEFIHDWHGGGNVWEAFRVTCDPTSAARKLFGSYRSQPSLQSIQKAQVSFSDEKSSNMDFRFASRPDDNFDFCNNAWARYQQGHFFSDWRTIPVLLPILSPGKAPGYNDLLIPSHYYYSPSSKYTYGWDRIKTATPKEVDDLELPWENKTNKIFWRGATTGGGSTPAGFSSSYQRQRFVEMAGSESNITRRVLFKDPKSKQLVSADASLGSINNEIMDVGFTRATACKPETGGCDAIYKRFRFAETVPLGEHWRHKYLIDLDGMGYSARSMAFLASGSALLKSTVYREFFTDWIQPWVHYIPISQSYREIYNIYAFFSGPPLPLLKAANSSSQLSDRTNMGNDLLLQEIAQNGRKWKQTTGRKVDMEAYVYRLCLEYARLWADDREFMSMK
ncbi:hypothetical protein Clacol_008971 [Clathrus columnatus]|uniref:Glycosyl transferase CAP10 domain-containing protein n=1 Tax=Clathrus columnatus TaxID=1419009 RepID=A0AAV5ANH3_9AGAM|nr:hypothetical protein Clacol_008971 [Clathrus columnatus]